MNLERIKLFLKELGKYSVLTAIILASFFTGRFYEDYQKEEVEETVTKVYKDDINIAIDENNNLILIYKETGEYTILQDSIGTSIFKLYAKNIWSQHNNN